MSQDPLPGDDYYDEYQHFQPVVGFRQPIVVKEEPKKEQDFSKIPGIPGIDFPLYHSVPPTSFSCAHVPVIPGMYANVETGCQVNLNSNFLIFYVELEQNYIRVTKEII